MCFVELIGPKNYDWLEWNVGPSLFLKLPDPQIKRRDILSFVLNEILFPFLLKLASRTS